MIGGETSKCDDLHEPRGVNKGVGTAVLVLYLILRI